MSARVAAKAAGRYHHGELRSALIDLALDVVSTEGVEELRLRDLARRLDVNHRAVYRHFADREALVIEVAILGWKNLGKRLQRAQKDSSAPIRDSLRSYIRFALTRGGHYRCMLGRGSATLDRDPDLRRATLETIRIVEAEVAEQMNAQSAPVRDCVFALWGLTHGVCDLVLCGHARVGSARKAEDWILRLAEPVLEKYGLR